MRKFIVTYTRIPTNYNDPVSVVVEAATESDARAIVKDHLRDFASLTGYTYEVKLYTPPPAGKILGAYV
jgi:hypothetical protein